MTPEEIEEVEERARKATAGPWRWGIFEMESPSGNVIALEWGYYDDCKLIFSDEDAEFVAHARADVPALVAEVRRLREERDEATAAERREHAAMILRDYRGVEDPCPVCDGWGIRIYPSTARWRGGVGGQAITPGVCDRCWGSGDGFKPWVSMREVEATRARVERLEAEVARLREALDAAGKLVKRYNVKTDDCRECGVNERCEAHR